MNNQQNALTSLSDDELLTELLRLAARERTATVRLIAALAEVDARRLYLGQGCSSLFVYCTRVLRLSEHAAYGRIEAARAARRFPMLLEALESGELTLTSICLLASHLTDANYRDVLARAKHRTKGEVEEIVASLRPRPDVPASVRKLPERTAAVVTNRSDDTPPPSLVLGESAPTAPSPATRAVLEPLAPERYKLQVTISGATQNKLRLARDLLRHSIPSGDLAAILDRALDLLLADLERTKVGVCPRPRRRQDGAPGSRHIPASVRRAVWERDGGQCAFKGPRGRCNESGFVECHHVRPFADGGEPSVQNIELRCRAHNQYEADLFFGDPVIVRERPTPYLL